MNAKDRRELERARDFLVRGLAFIHASETEVVRNYGSGNKVSIDKTIGSDLQLFEQALAVLNRALRQEP